MKAVLALICFIGCVAGAQSPGFTKGFVKITKDRDLYVEVSRAKPGLPTVVLLNGLTYSTVQWARFSEALSRTGVGVVRYDMEAMGQTLLKRGPVLAPIAYQNQVSDLKLLLKALSLPAPYNFVGLSYGGGIALAYANLYPREIGNLVLMAPFTEPLQQQDQWIKSQIWMTRQSNPLNMASDDQLYDFFLRQVVYSTYPSAEPIVLENPYKLEAVYRMVQGIRKYPALTNARTLPTQAVHLIIAAKDQYIPREVMFKFWKNVPVTARRSLTVLEESEHKIPEAVPNFSAALVAEMVRGNKLFAGGRSFQATPSTGVVRYEGGQLQLPRER